jgi:hypothetical protein
MSATGEGATTSGREEGKPVHFISADYATLDDVAWDDAAVAQYLNALGIVRGAAEKWAATTTAIFAAFGFVAFIDGRDEIRGLARWYEIATGVLVLSGLLAAVGAVILAALAAQGTPRQVAWTGPELRHHELEEARRATKRLTRSRVTTTLAVLAILVALGLLFYSPGDKSSAPRLLLVSHSGQTVCGTVISYRKGVFRLKTDNGPEAMIAENIASVASVDSCPTS